MSTRRARQSTDSVALFPFLAVLLCTMGGLLVLLVVLSEAAKRRPAVVAQPVEPVDPADAEQRAAALARIDELHAADARLGELERQAADRLADEQARLAHSEQQQRALEHALAKLHVALEQLAASEDHQSVDRVQAEAELQRLKQLVEDTHEQLDNLRSQEGGPKSYAIVPYHGDSGTFRRPIFVECTADGVVIQPEGIKLTDDDFIMSGRAGNPLAAAIRAARERLNEDARRAGVAEMPDAYPLLLVRPGGIKSYFSAMRAIRAWDDNLGYEFVDADWKLEFPPIDPVLAGVMNHAVMQSRERMLVLAQAAPSRFQYRLTGGGQAGSAGAGGRYGGGAGLGAGQSEMFNSQSQTAVQLAESQGSGSGTSDGYASAGNTSPGESESATANRYSAGLGELVDPNSGDAGATNLTQAAQGGAADGTSGGAESAQAGHGSNAGEQQNGATGQPCGNEQCAAGGSQSSATTSASSSSAGVPGNVASVDGAAGGSAGGVSMTPSTGSSGQGSVAPPLAETRGRDWALNLASQNAAPITRPIQAVVRIDSIDLLPTRVIDPVAAPGVAEVRLDQPTEKAVEDLVLAVREQIGSWGLAGRGLYWKPVLVLSVGPNAEGNAQKLAQLLEGSGIDVRLPQTARGAASGGTHGTTR